MIDNILYNFFESKSSIMLDNLILDIVIIFNILVLFFLFFCLPFGIKAGSGEIADPDLGEICPFYAES